MVPPEGESVETLEPETAPDLSATVTDTMQQAMAAALAVQQFAQEKQGGEVKGQHSRSLVADLCKIIERQSQEIASLVQGRQSVPTESPVQLNAAAAKKPKDGVVGAKLTVATVLAVKSNESEGSGNTQAIGNSNAEDDPMSADRARAYTCGLEALTAAADDAEALGDSNKNGKRRRPKQPSTHADGTRRQCLACGTSDTPKWRCGMTLCNACGLRNAKRTSQPPRTAPYAASMPVDDAYTEYPPMYPPPEYGYSYGPEALQMVPPGQMHPAQMHPAQMMHPNYPAQMHPGQNYPGQMHSMSPNQMPGQMPPGSLPPGGMPPESPDMSMGAQPDMQHAGGSNGVPSPPYPPHWHNGKMQPAQPYPAQSAPPSSRPADGTMVPAPDMEQYPQPQGPYAQYPPQYAQYGMPPPGPMHPQQPMGPPHPRPPMGHGPPMGHPGMVPRHPPPPGYGQSGPQRMPPHGGYQHQYGGYMPQQKVYHQPMPMQGPPPSSMPQAYPGPAPPAQMSPAAGMMQPLPVMEQAVVASPVPSSEVGPPPAEFYAPQQ